MALIYTHTGLEVGGIESPNANHFRGNCESLWQNDSPNFFGAANHFWPIANHFLKGFAKRPFSRPHPFLTSNFPIFRQILCRPIGCKNTNKLRIMTRNCKSLCKRVSQWQRDDQKMVNHFSLHKSSSVCIYI